MAKKTKQTSSSSKTNNGKANQKGFRWWRFFWQTLAVLTICFAALMLYLHADVRKRFEGQRWTEPASVYAREHRLREGELLSATDLELELQLLGYRLREQPARAGEYRREDQQFYIRARAFTFVDQKLPERIVVLSIRDGRVSRLRDGNGEPLAEARLDPVLLGRFSPSKDEDRELVRLTEVPQHLIDALLVAEDRQFYSHFGINPTAIARAAWANIRAGQTEQGASTITQQLVKNYFLNSERTWWRKIREALMAIILEANYDKGEILESYLNEIYLGQDGQRAIHGVALASRYYFGKPLQELAEHESALLVAMLRGPSYYSPWRNSDRAKSRRDLVLKMRADVGQLSSTEMQQLQRKSLGVVHTPRKLSGGMPTVLDAIKRELKSDVGAIDFKRSGVQIFTSIDAVTQRKAELVVSKGLNRLDEGKALQAAMVIKDRRNGLVRALVGGRDTDYAGFNRALDAKRAVGSTLKPIIYYTALKRSPLFTLATPLQDSSFVMRADDGKTWQPKNYDGQSRGIVSLHRALSDSLNLATARLAMEVGLKQVEKSLREMGIERPIALWPSLALGALELSPLEVATLYSGIAHGQQVMPSHAIVAARFDDGEVWRRQTESLGELHPASSFLTAYTLQEAVRDGTGKSLGARYPSLNLAGKTGTTNDTRDSWFVGFDDEYLIVTWLGRDDNQSTGLTGASGAMQLFADMIAVKTPAPLSLRLPASVRFAYLDGSGNAYGQACDRTEWLPVIMSDEMRMECP